MSSDQVQFDRGTAERVVAATYWAESMYGQRVGTRRHEWPVPQEEVQSGGTTRPAFLGEIFPFGPQLEDDFTDWRYWVWELQVEFDEGKPVFSTMTRSDRRIVWAINLDEWQLEPNDSHIIRKRFNAAPLNSKRRRVLCWQMTVGLKPEVPPDPEAPETTKIWVFGSYPGQMSPGYKYHVHSLDSDGCPHGYWGKAVGPAVTANETPP